MKVLKLLIFLEGFFTLLENYRASFLVKRSIEEPGFKNLIYFTGHDLILAEKKYGFQAVTGQIRFVAESATLLHFSDILCCFGFYEQIPKTLYRSKLLQK